MAMVIVNSVIVYSDNAYQRRTSYTHTHYTAIIISSPITGR